ncbi:MAG: hypothetical protein C4308_11685 [Chitinophagaceae bacterium]
MNDKLSVPAYVCLAFFGFYLLIEGVDFLFFKKWGKRFSINEVKTFQLHHDAPGLETFLIIKFLSDKRKELLFRTKEREFERVISLLQNQNSAIKVAG